MKISVIIPVYNVARYLQECLDFVRAQTVGDWEAICVDDGSTDGSGVILDKYAAEDARFKVIHQANEDVSAARNVGLEVAQGDWVTFIDADDTVDAEWFARAVELMGEEVDHVRFLREGEEREAQVVTGRDAAEWCWRVFPTTCNVWLSFMRRRAIEGVRFRGGVVYAEDLLFLLETIPALRGIAQGEFKGYHYRVVRGSASRRKRPGASYVVLLKACLEIWRAQRAWAAGIRIEEIVRERLRFVVENEVLDALMWGEAVDWGELRWVYCELEKEGALSERFRLKSYVVPSFILRRLGSFIGYWVLVGPTRVVRGLRWRV